MGRVFYFTPSIYSLYLEFVIISPTKRYKLLHTTYSLFHYKDINRLLAGSLNVLKFDYTPQKLAQSNTL